MRCCTKGGSSGPMQCVCVCVCVCVERGWEGIQSTVHMGDVCECEDIWQEWHMVLCEEVGGERQLMSFALKMLS